MLAKEELPAFASKPIELGELNRQVFTTQIS